MTALARDPLELKLLYSPQTPTPAQHAFLLLDDLGVADALYGGAAGGGKSSALIMSALRYVDVPYYAAILLRRTYADLALPGALMDRAKEWLIGKPGVGWDAGLFRFTFPSKATLTFGYLQTANDKYRYQGAEFQFVGIDEGTQIPEGDQRYMFSRLRKPALPEDREPTDEELARVGALTNVPLRFRVGSNPGGRSHLYVRGRYIEKKTDPDDPADTPEKAAARVFIPAKLGDNPHVDQASYLDSLANLDPFERDQLLNGDWYARQPGDWVYDQNGLAAAAELGADLEAELRAGTITPPAGGLGIGNDWGEQTHSLIGWPLEAGGLWVAREVPAEGGEPGMIAGAVLDELGDLVELLERAEARQTDTRKQRPPRRVTVTAPRALARVESHRFDAAGAQSQRTYIATVRRHHRRAISVGVAFGAPAKSGGTAASPRSFKAETIGYLRRMVYRVLALRRYDDDVDAMVRDVIARPGWTDKRIALMAESIRRVGPLAIGPACPELLRQARALEFADVDLGTIKKGDDHGPDALIALTAPLAKRNR